MEILNPITTELVKTMVAIAKERIGRAFADKPGKAHHAVIPEHLEAHLQEVAAWSETIQFYGMTAGTSTDSVTVPLMHSAPRKFRGNGGKTEAQDEANLISSTTEHCLLLGDPGAGKTTTIKRLARRMLSAAPSLDADFLQYPLLLRLRELTGRQSLHSAIANAIGLTSNLATGPEPLTGEQESFERSVARALDESRAALLLDGLDEVLPAERGNLEEELVRLGRRLKAAKIILTCRSGEHSSELEGFSVTELCPLEPEQVQDIADRWLPGRGKEFLQALQKVPYYDLTDRPLLLTQLLVVFDRYDFLPERPVDVYKWIVRLLLEDWDRHRRIRRPSKYGQFTPDRKAEFLSSLSYRLTYIIRSKSFTSQQFMDAYLSIHKHFGLPSNEASEVVGEIQTHAGLIVAAGLGYEFSHLSIQEYLCANHLVRDPFPEYLDRYMAAYPAPLAIAIALSANPSAWFSALLLSSRNGVSLAPLALHALLTRLTIERAQFEPTPELGVAVLRVASEIRGSQSDPLMFEHAFTKSVLQEALVAGLAYYQAVARGHGSHRIRLKLIRRLHSRFALHAPSTLSLDERVVSYVLDSLSASFACVDNLGEPFVATKLVDIERLVTEA